MKKLIALLLFIVALSSTPVFANRASNAPAGQTGKTEAALIVNRVHEIRKMDQTKLSSKERADLKAELKGIKKKINDPGVGIYISGTALLIIIILLILFL